MRAPNPRNPQNPQAMKKPQEPDLPMPPHWEGGANMPESMKILLEPPPWPEIEWIADMAHKLLPRHRKKGKPEMDVWKGACEEAVAIHRLAFETIRRKRHAIARAPLDSTLIDHFITPQLKAKEREEQHVSYERGCKLVTEEDKRLRALKAFEELAGAQNAEHHRRNGFTLNEVWTWRMRWARRSKKFYENVKKMLAAENGQKAAAAGQPPKKTGQKKKRPPKKGPGK